jgi:hypothetical protein
MRRTALRVCRVFNDALLVCNHRPRLVVATVALLGLALLGPAVPRAWAQAQAFSASLRGFVYDNSGAVIPAATVTLSNPERGFTQTFSTQPDGTYAFTLLGPGTYNLRVEKSGFRPYLQSGIVLAVGQTAAQDVTLQVGAVTQEVTVTAGAPMLNTSSANVASEVAGRQIVELPLNFRHVFGLIFLNSAANNAAQWQMINNPGQQGTADQDMYFLTIGGGRFGTTAVLLDGHWDAGGDWGGFVYVPSVDNTQEFKIQTNSFSAQYGWSTGNVVSAVTKSGTREFHGSAFEFLRNDNLDANLFFSNRAGLSKPEFKRNQFGFSAGGPIYIPKLYEQRDKTFIFGDYEGLRQGTPMSWTGTVPTKDMRTGDFSALLGAATGTTDALGRPILTGQIYDPNTTRQLTNGGVDTGYTGLPVACPGSPTPTTCYIRDPIAGNDLSGMINSVSKNFLQYWPDPLSNALAGNLTWAGSGPVGSDEYSIRVDHNISEKSRLFVRWSQKREFKQMTAEIFGHNNPGGPGVTNPNNRYDAGINFNRTFTPTAVMSVNLGLSRWAEGNHAQAYPFTPSTLGLPAFLDGNSPEFPNINVSDIQGLGPGQLSGGAGEGMFPRSIGSYSVDFTKVRGSHNMTMGFMGVVHQNTGGRFPITNFTFPRSMTQGPDPQAPIANTGYGFASFLLGTGSSGDTSVAPFKFVWKKMYGLYFQDDWKATRKLTLNLGIRYDYQPGPTEQYDRTEYLDFTARNPISDAVGFTVPGQLVFVGGGNRRNLYEAQKTNFAPRIGLAYQLTDKLVLRSGAGIFFTQAWQLDVPMDGYSMTTYYTGSVDGIHVTNKFDNPFPSGLTMPTGSSLGGLTDVGLSPSAPGNYRPTPYVEQWMLGLQYAITQNDMIDVTYIGNHGVKLPFSGLQKNQLPVNDMAMGNALLDPVANPFYGHITSSGCGLDGATVPAGQLRRPFPQFCGVTDSQAPGAFSTYNAAQITFNHRWSQGMQFVASYTVSKYITNSEGPGEWATNGGWGAQVRSYYDLAAEKSLSASDTPQSLVLNYIYELPVGRGKRFGSNLNRAADAVLGGWQVSGISTFKSGIPLGIATGTNNTNSFGGGQRPNLVADPHVSHPTIDRWFNTDAFDQPPPFTFGDVPRYMPNLRAPGYNNWDLAIQKWWARKERLRVQFRAEMFNAFNHPNFYAPNQTMGGGFGMIFGTYPARDVQFGLKVYW